MALQVWMPLNGNLNNYGVSNLKFSIISPAATILNGDGKIGVCYTNSSNTVGGIVSLDVISLGSKQSMFCWMNFASLMSSSSLGGAMVTQHRYSNNTGMGLTIKYVSSTTGYLSVNTGNGSSRTYNTYCATTLMQAGTWYHVGYTYDGASIRLYVNGVCEKTVAFTGMSVPADYIALFTWSMAGTSTGSNETHPNYLLNGKLNDVRVYDHCLSPQEVRELSRGLIVHYPLNSPEIPLSKYSSVNWNQLIPNGDFSNGTNNWVIHDSSLEEISVSNGEILVTKKASSYGGMCRVSPFTITDISDKYYIKATLRSNDGVTSAFFGFCTSSWTVGSNTQYSTTSSEYETISFIASPAANTSYLVLRIGAGSSPINASLTCKNIFCVNLTQMFGSGHEPTKEECDTLFYADYYPYDTGTTKNLVRPIQDCSGYGHNATPVNTVTLVDESPRYDRHAQFSTTSYIKCTSPTAEARSASFWLKIPSIPTSSQSLYQVVFVDYKSKLGFCIGRSNAFSTSVGGTDYYSAKYSITPITVDNWHHIVVVNTGTSYTSMTRNVYIDGVLQTPLTTTDYWNYTDNELQIGRRSNANNYTTNDISDFRLYVTALTQEDVLDLYHTSAMIDNLGSIHAFDLIEDNVNSQELYDTGVFKTRHFIESNDNLLIDTDGSVFLKILHHNNPASKMFTQENAWLNNDPDLFSNLIILKDSPVFNNLSEYRFIVKERLTTSSTEVTYRWKQTSNPALTSTATGYQTIATSPPRSLALMNKGTYGAMHNGSAYWCCCGSWTQYNGGNPGFSDVVTTGYTDLYVKIPDTLLKGYIDETAKFYTDSIYSKQFLEI